MSLTNRVLNGAVRTYKRCEQDVLGVRPQVVCRDGFKVSIQAGTGYKCTPENDDGPYTHVELGYPAYPRKLKLYLRKIVGITLPEKLITPYALDKRRLMQTVYQQVPVGIVDQLLTEHGGVIAYEGDLECTCLTGGEESCFHCREVVII